MSDVAFHYQRQRVAHKLRQLAEPYTRSNKQYDQQQGQTLLNIADDIIGNEMEQALLRFDALHREIRKSLPFEVLDFIDRVEVMFDR